MTWRTEKTRAGQDLVWEGGEFGVAASPLQGTANLQNVNIATELGEVMASFARENSPTQTPITGETLTPNGATDFTGPSTLLAGQWIEVTASTVTNIDVVTTPASVSVDYLVVGGGGGGGGSNTYAGGGGGAGEFVTGSASLAVGSFPIVVGALGAGGGPGSQGGDGTSSTFNSVTAIGGGGGGDSALNQNGRTGASGGGGGANSSTAGTGGAGTAGNNGGNGDTTTEETGGGGGGDSSVGTNGDASSGGDGGDGTLSTITGEQVYYSGGGGGGGSGSSVAGPGGIGGGGAGGNDAEGENATANTGGGGGGGAGTNFGGDGADGVVIISYTRGTMLASGGTITTYGNKIVHTFTTSGVFVIDTIYPTAGYYFVSSKSGTTFTLSETFDPYATNTVTHGTTGTVTFNIVATPSKGISKATEPYLTGTETRYYVLDQNSYVWVYDTQVFASEGTSWMLTNPFPPADFSAIAVINGWLLSFSETTIFGTPTVLLGETPGVVRGGYMTNRVQQKYAVSTAQGRVYYTDGPIIGEIFPTTSLLTTLANIQSYCSYTSDGVVGSIDEQLSGSLPYTQDSNGETARIPAVFFTDGTQPTNLEEGDVYWIQMAPGTLEFTVFSSQTGGAPIDIETGAAGNQYFNTFYPISADAGSNGANSTVQLSIQRMNLPASEIATYLLELGNIIIISGRANILYPWNQQDAIPSDLIILPENDVKTMINVNNMAYIFAGNKGNVYISNGSTASLALKIPDYTAGVPGTPNSYIEPTFDWQDASYIRGRIYCSLIDQTSTKAGNCGGVWSFVPSENVDPNQQIGNALRLENRNSYGTYSGGANLIIPFTEQDQRSPQYFTWWQSSTSTPTYGIDVSSLNPVTAFVIETDLAPTGTMLEKQTFQQIEYKLSTPLLSGDSLQLYYRNTDTAAWTSLGTVRQETNNPLSGYYPVNFDKTQWLQIRAEATTNGTTSSSFVRVTQIRVR